MIRTGRRRVQTPLAHGTYNGVNAHPFDYQVDLGEVKRRYAIGPVDPLILFTGRLTAQKGPDILVRATPSVMRNYPHAKFVFAGEDHMRGELCGLAHQLGVAEVGFLLRNGEFVAAARSRAMAFPPTTVSSHHDDAATRRVRTLLPKARWRIGPCARRPAN